MMENNKASDLLKTIDRGLRVTGIGSVPFADSAEACEIILEHCPLIPYVPQLIKRDVRQNMFLQFSENLPCLMADVEKGRVLFDETRDREKELGKFYENLEHDGYEYFRINPEYAPALPIMLDKCRTRANTFIKTQVTGPVTYLLSLRSNDGRPVIYDDEFAQAITIGLAMKGLWQAQQIRKTGKKPLLFFDEPSLSELGSAYAPVPREKARSLIDDLLDFIKDRDPEVITGVHCCGNTDWGMLLGSAVDIVSLDSYSCGEKLMLYPNEIGRFLQRGGVIAYGIVPTSEYVPWTEEQALYGQFIAMLAELEEKGVSKDVMLDHAIFTPACGMGPLRSEDANRILELVVSLSRRIQEQNNR